MVVTLEREMREVLSCDTLLNDRPGVARRVRTCIPLLSESIMIPERCSKRTNQFFDFIQHPRTFAQS